LSVTASSSRRTRSHLWSASRMMPRKWPRATSAALRWQSLPMSRKATFTRPSRWKNIGT
jgi:IF-2: translation initiation factor IF-2